VNGSLCSHSCSRHLRHSACHSPLSLQILIPSQDTSGLASRNEGEALTGVTPGNDPTAVRRLGATTFERNVQRRNDMDSPSSHLLRRGRVSEPGRLYLLTTPTRERLPLFADFCLARAAIGQLRMSDEEGACRTLAWVLMPDHLHWLVALGPTSLGSLMCAFKSRSSGALYRAGAERRHIWQAGYHDRALRKEEDVRAVARYIVANPVRAGLVRRAGDYPHWDCVWL